MTLSFGATATPDERDAPAGPARFRRASENDADQIALLHADSWRRHYRGAYADSFLDGDVVADRRCVWSARLAAPTNSETVLAEQGRHVLGFIHVVFDEDPQWGSLVDNLHVRHDSRRMGIGTQLLRRAARAVTRHGTGNAMYLWVLQQNTAAQQFYRSCGATCGETTLVSPPGQDPKRLHGKPSKLRMIWPDVASLFLLDNQR
ncbi:GNAT family N-acetyltransferase [Micromonospora sp. CPCC 206061]|uniref:GNAT family N-acetyltransferase n=1 Tax=Micromonospora sp. CPCC 206061 TaxID=3122410 RepID=UPI002FF0A288